MLLHYLERLKKEAELEEELEEEEPGLWSFFINEDLSLSLRESVDGSLLLEAELGPVPSRLDRLEEMLQSNLGLKGTLGSNLGLDPTATKSILWRKISTNADYEWFYNEFEDFLNGAEYWSCFVLGKEMV